jgi:hypothetical protein
LPLIEAAGDRDDLVSILDDLGLLHYSLDNDEIAITHSARALAMYEEDGNAAAAERLRERLEDLAR